MQSPETVPENHSPLEKKPSFNFDELRSIMKDLHEFGKSCGDEKIINQAVVGQNILNEHDRTISWLQRSSNDLPQSLNYLKRVTKKGD